MTNETELKPCPFCNSEAKLGLVLTHAFVECRECHARAVALITVREQPDIDYFKSLAINQWNTRTDAELQGKYDKLFDYVRKCAEYGQCFESDGSHGHWINCHVNAEKLLCELGEAND